MAIRSLLAGATLLLITAGPATGAAAAPAAGGYEVRGTPVTGGSAPSTATRLVPGQYTDTLDRAGTGVGQDGSVRYYALTLRPGDTPYVVATLVRPAGTSADDLQVDVELGTIQDGDFDPSCDVDEQQTADGFGDPYDAATAVLTTAEVGGTGWPSGCPDGGTFTIAVTRAGDAFAGTPARLELGVRVEPHADASGLPGPVTAKADNVQPDPGSLFRAVRGGSSYDDATVLTRGTYRDSVPAGQTRYYRVRLTWGQRLACTVTADRLGGTNPPDVPASVVLTNPVRQVLAPANSSNLSDTAWGSTTTGALYGSGAAPVRWTNRLSTNTDLKPFSVAGDYFVIVSTGPPDPGAPAVTVSYTLQIGLAGTRERGPVYGPGTADATGSPSAGSGGGSSFPLVPVLVAAAAIVVLALVGTVVLRRRVSPRGATRSVRS